MRNYFEFLMEQLLSCGKDPRETSEPVLNNIDKKQIKLEFRKILDKLVINIIEANFENETLIQALMELARIERIIVVLYYVCGIRLSEIAYLLDTDLNSIYVQKCTAIIGVKNLPPSHEREYLFQTVHFILTLSVRAMTFIRHICKPAQILLIFPRTQTAFGRSANWNSRSLCTNTATMKFVVNYLKTMVGTQHFGFRHPESALIPTRNNAVLNVILWKTTAKPPKELSFAETVGVVTAKTQSGLVISNFRMLRPRTVGIPMRLIGGMTDIFSMPTVKRWVVRWHPNVLFPMLSSLSLFQLSATAITEHFRMTMQKPQPRVMQRYGTASLFRPF